MGRKGLVHRYNEQVLGKNGPGTEIWDNHTKSYNNDRRELRKEIRRYRNSWNDNGRGGKDPCPETELIKEAEEWSRRPAPTKDDHKGPEGDAPFPLRLVAGIGAGVAGVAALVALVSPFDGPLGEMGFGAGAAALWGFAVQ